MTPKRTAEVTKARYFADEDENTAKTATTELDITVEDGAETPAENNKQPKSDIPAIIPILPLRGLVVYPQTAIPGTEEGQRTTGMKFMKTIVPRFEVDAVEADKPIECAYPKETVSRLRDGNR